MKRILTILFMIIGVYSYSQVPAGYIKLNTKVNYIGIKGDSAVIIPGDTLYSAPLNSIAIKGGKFWMKLSTFWTEVISGSGVDSVYKKGLTDSVFFRMGGIAFFAFRDSVAGGGGSDGNNYPTGLTFSTATGVVTITRSGLGDLTQDLDGKYVNIADTAAMQAASRIYLDNANGVGDSLYRIIGGVYQWKRITSTNRIKVTSGDSVINLDVLVRNLGTGVPDATKFLRGDSTWAGPDSILFMTRGRGYKAIDSSLAASAYTFDNPNIGDTLFTVPSPNVIQIKSLIGTGILDITPSDSTLVLNVPATGFTTLQDCPTYLDVLLNENLISGITADRYFAFPSITKTNTGRLLLGVNNRRNHSDSGMAVLYTSDDYGLTFPVIDTIESVKADNWTNPFVGRMTGDTLIMTYSRDGSTLGTFWRISVDNGETWDARKRFITGDTLVTCGKPVLFKGKWVVPIYGVSPSLNRSGVLYSTNSGTTWTPSWLVPGLDGLLQLNEAEMVVNGDSLIIFVRSINVGNDTLYRAASFDAVTWTIPWGVYPPLYWTGKPAVIRMNDGRILLNYRSQDIPFAGSPYYGRVAISGDNGITWTNLYKQETLPFMYGSWEYTGGDKYINVHSNEPIGVGTQASIYRDYYKIPSCEVLLNGVEVEKIGDPLWDLGISGATYTEGYGIDISANVIKTDTAALRPWVATFGSSGGWGTTGNSGTSPATNFIGTTDDQSLKFKINNTHAGLITNTAQNTNFGYRSGVSITSGTGNTGFGYNTQQYLSTGTYNTAIGNAAMAFSTLTGTFNTGVGSHALNQISTGIENTAVGYNALATMTDGETSVGVGVNTFSTNTSGSGNTGLGSYAGYTHTSGSRNIAIGWQAYLNSATGSYQGNIGNIIYGVDWDGSQSTISSGGVGIGVKVPLSRFHVDGTVRFPNLGTATFDTTNNKAVGINSSGILIPMAYWPVGTGGGGSPGGSNTQVQFNDASAFGGDAELTYNKTTNGLHIGGTGATSYFDLIPGEITINRSALRMGFIDQASTSGLLITVDGGDGVVRYQGWTTNPISFQPTSGNMLVGTATEGAGKLQVNGDVRVGTIANATTDLDKFLVSDAGVLKYRTGAEVLSDIGGGSGSGTLAVIDDIDYTVAAGVTDVVYKTMTAGRTVTLPAASSNTNRKITIKNGGQGAFNITLSTAVRENSTTTTSTIVQSFWMTIMSDGTEWWIVAIK